MSTLSEDHVRNMLRQAVSSSLAELLESKTLYQSVSVDRSKIDDAISRVTARRPLPMVNLGGSFVTGHISETGRDATAQKPFREFIHQLIDSPWEFENESTGYVAPNVAANRPAAFSALLPTAKFACNFCDAVLPPHNGGNRNGGPITGTTLGRTKTGIVQIFAIPYQCQSCKGEIIFFLVRREGLRLSLTGRSHLKVVTVAKSLPKQEAQFFREAVIAHAAGKTLAGLFFLRTFVEQYLRRLTQAKARTRGEDLADSYSKLLDAEFPKKLTTLKVVYEELSEKLHEADASVSQFEKSKREIELHFDQLRIVPLKSTESQE